MEIQEQHHILSKTLHTINIHFLTIQHLIHIYLVKLKIVHKDILDILEQIVIFQFVIIKIPKMFLFAQEMEIVFYQIIVLVIQVIMVLIVHYIIVIIFYLILQMFVQIKEIVLHQIIVNVIMDIKVIIVKKF